MVRTKPKTEKLIFSQDDTEYKRLTEQQCLYH